VIFILGLEDIGSGGGFRFASGRLDKKEPLRIGLNCCRLFVTCGLVEGPFSLDNHNGGSGCSIPSEVCRLRFSSEARL